VNIDGAIADGTSAGHGDPCLAESGQERAQNADAGANLPHNIILANGIIQRPAVDAKGPIGEAFHLCSHTFQQHLKRLNIRQMGGVGNRTDADRENHRRHNRQG